MPEEEVLPKDRIVASFKQLNNASIELNAIASQLAKSITSLEEALNRLNLGVSAWYEIAGNEDHQNGSYWSRDVGYTKIGYEWRIALRQLSGNHQVEDSHNEQIWVFSDAPRWMCVDGAGKLPELFDELIKRTVATTEKLKARIPQTEDLAAAVRAIQMEADAAKQTKKGRR